MHTIFYTSVSILNVASDVFILFDKGMLLKETIHAILLTMGVWSSGYDSCFGCRRSRVQIPERPHILTHCFYILKINQHLFLIRSDRSTSMPWALRASKVCFSTFERNAILSNYGSEPDLDSSY